MLTLLLICFVVLDAQRTPADQLQINLDAAIKAKQPKFTFPGGSINFGAVPLNILNAESMLLDGNQTTLIFSPGFGVLIQRCKRVVLRSISIDYSPPPFVFGKITSILSNNGNEMDVTVQLSPESMSYETIISSYPPHDIWPPTVIIDQNEKVIRCTPCGWGHPPYYEKKTNNTYILKQVCGSGTAVGDVIVSPTRHGFTYLVLETDDLVSENINIHHASYFAILEANSYCGNVYRKINISSPYPDRPFGSNADSFHSAGCREAPILTDSYIRNVADDFFNVHNTLQFVGERLTDHSIIVIDPHIFPGPPNTLYGTLQTMNRVIENDVLSFWPLNMLSANDRLGSGIVKEVSLLTDDKWKSLIKEVYETNNAIAKDCPLNACSAGLHKWAGAELYNVTFLDPLPASIKKGNLVDVATIANRHFHAKNNDFYGTSSSLGRMKSINGVIEKNKLGHSCAANLETGPLQHWIEGPLGIEGVIIRNNIITKSGSAPFHSFDSEVTYTDNTIIP